MTVARCAARGGSTFRTVSASCSLFPAAAVMASPVREIAHNVLRDLVRGYISAQSARDDYGLSDEEISNAYEQARLGQDV